MRVQILMALALTACIPAPAAEGASPRWETIARLVRTAPQKCIDSYFFSGSEYGLCIIDEGGGPAKYGSIRQALTGNHCVAGVNGGYFGADAAKTPLGLMRHNGKSITGLATKGFAVSGVLYDTGKEIRLERSTSLTCPVERMREAVQGGPFLVEGGRTIRGLDDKRKAKRTFVATDGRGNWCIAVTRPMTLHELGTQLAAPGTLKPLRVEKALNLDGGSSSAMWTAKDGCLHGNLKAVRNYVGVSKRRK